MQYNIVIFYDNSTQCHVKEEKAKFFQELKSNGIKIQQKSQDFILANNIGYYFVNILYRYPACFLLNHENISKAYIIKGKYVSEDTFENMTIGDTRVELPSDIELISEYEFSVNLLLNNLKQELKRINVFYIIQEENEYIVDNKEIFKCSFNKKIHFYTKKDALKNILLNSQNKQKTLEEQIKNLEEELIKEKKSYNEIMKYI